VPTYTPDEFAAILDASPVEATKEVRKTVGKGALNVKTAAQANVLSTAPRHNAGAYKAITYDDPTSGPVISSEIGYDKRRRGGALGNLLEFGGGGDHSPPHHDLRLALEAEDPRFTDAVGDAGFKAIK